MARSSPPPATATRELSDVSAHAELLAIRQAGARLGSDRLPGADLYVTLEPCTLCAAAISFARIRRLYYGAEDEKGGAVDNGVRFFSAPTCHHARTSIPASQRRKPANPKRFFRERAGGLGRALIENPTGWVIF